MAAPTPESCAQEVDKSDAAYQTFAKQIGKLDSTYAKMNGEYRLVADALGEGALAEHLDATVARYPAVGIGSYPRFDEADYRVKVTFDGREEASVREAAAFLRRRIPADCIIREE